MNKKRALIISIFLFVLLILPFTAYADAPQQVAVTITVQTSEGHPLSNVSISGAEAGSAQHPLGATNDIGELTIGIASGQYDITAKYENTKQTKTNITIDAENTRIDFFTTQAKVKVEDAAGIALAGANVTYVSDAQKNILGTTGPDGIVIKELFSDTYDMQATYHGTISSIVPVDITPVGIDYTFVASNVMLNYSGPIQYQGIDGNMYPYTKPYTAMFPGTYPFFFGEPDGPKTQTDIAIEGAEYTANIAVVSLENSEGKGLAGGEVSYYARGWVSNAAITDANGLAVLQMPEDKTATSVAIKYHGGRNQINQNMNTHSNYDFRTKKVDFALLSSKKQPLSGKAMFYGAYGGWQNFGDSAQGKTNTSMEMLPMSYSFGVRYLGGWQQKKVDIKKESEVVFATTEVTFKLLSSKGDELTGDARYYAQGWKTFGSGITTATMELLPVKYTFGVTFMGGYQQKTQDVGSDPVVIFRTVPVTFKLLSSGGRPLVGTAKVYARGWKSFGSGQTTQKKKKPLTMELLPGKYTFGIEYAGGYLQKAQDITADKDVIFRTVKVKFKLLSSRGRNLQGDAIYYARGWKAFGDGKTPAKMELLPTKYTFGITFMGGYMQKMQDVGQDRNVIFRTVQVTFEILDADGTPLVGKASYYARGWKPFGKGYTSAKRYKLLRMEMLPIKYTFAAKYNGVYKKTSQDVSVDPSVVFDVDSSVGTMSPRAADNTPSFWHTLLSVLENW